MGEVGSQSFTSMSMHEFSVSQFSSCSSLAVPSQPFPTVLDGPAGGSVSVLCPVCVSSLTAFVLAGPASFVRSHIWEEGWCFGPDPTMCPLLTLSSLFDVGASVSIHDESVLRVWEEVPHLQPLHHPPAVRGSGGCSPLWCPCWSLRTTLCPGPPLLGDRL